MASLPAEIDRSILAGRRNEYKDKGGQHEVRIEPNDSNCYGNTRRSEFECCDDDQWSGCTTCPTTETTNGRRGLQECHSSQGTPGGPVHANVGNNRAGTGPALPGCD